MCVFCGVGRMEGGLAGSKVAMQADGCTLTACADVLYCSRVPLARAAGLEIERCLNDLVVADAYGMLKAAHYIHLCCVGNSRGVCPWGKRPARRHGCVEHTGLRRRFRFDIHVPNDANGLCAIAPLQTQQCAAEMLERTQISE